jgi:hypothetical protein
MGKASSAKKVARAARAGGVKRANRPRLTFPIAIVAILVLGGGSVVYAKNSHDAITNADAKPSSRNEDHWHAAYGFYVCDKFQENLKDIEGKEDVQGIHTHGDGVMHIHPTKPSASGERARMKVWAPMVGVEFYNDGWKLPDGQEFRQDTATCGDKPAKLAVYRWKTDNKRAPIEVFDKGFGDIAYTSDRDSYTFAVIPEDAPEPAPKPESIPQLDNLTDVEGAGGAAPGGIPGGLEGLEGLGGAPGGVQIPVDPAQGGGAPPAPAPAP